MKTCRNRRGFRSETFRSKTQVQPRRRHPFVLTALAGALLGIMCLSGCVGLTSAGSPAAKTDSGNNAGASAPAITAQPVSQTVTMGQTATFWVAASGAAPLSYQWRKNGAAISGATSTSYVMPTTSSDSGAAITVVVTNSVGSATSSPAML